MFGGHTENRYGRVGNSFGERCLLFGRDVSRPYLHLAFIYYVLFYKLLDLLCRCKYKYLRVSDMSDLFLYILVIIYYSGSRVVSLMTNGYSEQTVSGFRTLEGIWREYLGTHVSDVYLRDLPLVEAEECVLEFVAYLIDSMDFTGPKVIRALTQLRGVITIHGGCYSVFDSKRMEIARKSVRIAHVSMLNETVECPGSTGDARPIQLPMTVDLLDRIRELYWNGQSLTSRMIYIGSVVSFFRGLRIGNVASTGSYKNGKKDHRFLNSAIHIEVDQGFMTVKEWVVAGSPAVIAMKMKIVSSKTHGPTMKTKTVAPIVLMVDVGSFHEQQLFRDLLQWIKDSGMHEPTNFLFSRLECVGTRKKATCKCLKSSDVTAAIKRVVAEIGLDTARFNTRSLRIGANVEVDAQGATSGQRLMVLDHSSEVNNERYLRAMQHRDPNPLSAEGKVTTNDVVTMERYL